MLFHNKIFTVFFPTVLLVLLHYSAEFVVLGLDSAYAEPPFASNGAADDNNYADNARGTRKVLSRSRQSRERGSTLRVPGTITQERLLFVAREG